MSVFYKRSISLLGCDDSQTRKVKQALADMAKLANVARNTADTGSLGYAARLKRIWLGVADFQILTLLDTHTTSKTAKLTFSSQP